MGTSSRSYTGFKEPVKFTTTGNINLSGLAVQANGDWSAGLSAGDRILVKDQLTTSENGIYVADSGSWVRSRDADGHGELSAGMLVPVSDGSTALGSVWVLNPLAPGIIDPGVTNISFELAQSTLLIPYTEIDQPNGVAGLDGTGKINPAALPPGGLSYKGIWDANTNSPTLADGVGSIGDLYIVSVAGTQNLGSGAISFLVGDFVIYNALSVWERVATGGGTTVSSVNGLTGAVTINLDDVNDVALSGLADGSLLRYDTTGLTWANTTSSTMVLNDNGQLQLPATGATGGIVLGSGVNAANLYHSTNSTLKTDGKLEVGYGGGTKAELSLTSTAFNTGITFGGDSSANLYRSASGVLKADGKIQIGSSSSAVITVANDLTNKAYVDGRTSDASTSVKGVTKLSTAPASSTNPIAVGTNDPRIIESGNYTSRPLTGTGYWFDTDLGTLSKGSGSSRKFVGQSPHLPLGSLLVPSGKIEPRPGYSNGTFNLQGCLRGETLATAGTLTHDGYNAVWIDTATALNSNGYVTTAFDDGTGGSAGSFGTVSLGYAPSFMATVQIDNASSFRAWVGPSFRSTMLASDTFPNFGVSNGGGYAFRITRNTDTTWKLCYNNDNGVIGQVDTGMTYAQFYTYSFIAYIDTNYELNYIIYCWDTGNEVRGRVVGVDMVTNAFDVPQGAPGAGIRTLQSGVSKTIKVGQVCVALPGMMGGELGFAAGWPTHFYGSPPGPLV